MSSRNVLIGTFRVCSSTAVYTVESSSIEEVQKMEIRTDGSQPPAKGSSEWFTSIVRVDPLFQAPDPARVSGVSVTFDMLQDSALQVVGDVRV